VFRSHEMCLETVKTCSNSYVIIEPAHVLYLILKAVVHQVVRAHYKYFPVRGESNSAKETIQDGRTGQRKRSSLQQNG
jgi:hypothetical protein